MPNKRKKWPGKSAKPLQLNVSVRREVVEAVGSFMDAVIVHYIHYRFVKNGRREVWLKLDWIAENLPYIKRSALDQRLKKLARDGHIIIRRGQGKFYHKTWYRPSPEMIEACEGEGVQVNSGKVYYNPGLAEENLDASVVYAAISNLLRIDKDAAQVGLAKTDSGTGVEDKNLTLDLEKLAEGSGLPINRVRKAVRWLIDHKKIEAKNVFGNKRRVWIPPDPTTESDVPTESYPHTGDSEDLTEY